MDQVVAACVLAIAAVVGAVLVITNIAPSVTTLDDGIQNSGRIENELLSNHLTVVKVMSLNESCISLWLKNTGQSLIADVKQWDVIIKRTDQTFVNQIPYLEPGESMATCRQGQGIPVGNPCMDCWVETPEVLVLSPGDTTVLHIELGINQLTNGDYSVTIGTPQGAVVTGLFRHVNN
tara:strand:+ start:18134 stop:18667 length:534 start_codon:yes stop_codon:yes gene_type:complete